MGPATVIAMYYLTLPRGKMCARKSNEQKVEVYMYKLWNGAIDMQYN